MNKKLIALLGTSAIALHAAGSLWPADGMNSTQLSTTGYFYGYSDSEKDGVPVDGANSSFTWVNGLGQYDDPQLNADGTLPITLTIATGATDLFAALGANFEDPKAPVDHSAKSGYCVTYSSTAPMIFELKSTAVIDFANYTKAMPASAGFSVLDIPMSALKQPSDWGTKVPIATAAASTDGVAFKIEKAPARSVTFTIKQLGFAGECDGGGPISSAISNMAASSVKAVLVGRSLSFAGMGKATMQVEVINLQGQVVNRGVVSAVKSTLNLSTLSNGVYMVRAAGSDLKLSKRIVLN